MRPAASSRIPSSRRPGKRRRARLAAPRFPRPPRTFRSSPPGRPRVSRARSPSSTQLSSSSRAWTSTRSSARLALPCVRRVRRAGKSRPCARCATRAHRARTRRSSPPSSSSPRIRPPLPFGAGGERCGLPAGPRGARPGALAPAGTTAGSRSERPARDRGRDRAPADRRASARRSRRACSRRRACGPGTESQHDRGRGGSREPRSRGARRCGLREGGGVTWRASC